MPLKPIIAGLLFISLLACAQKESSGEVATDTTTATAATAATETTATVEPPPDPALVAEGEGIFRGQCARCHIGEMKSLRTPAVQSQSNADLEKTIRGANQMVSAKGTHKVLDLTDTEMKAVVAYIKSLE